VSRGTVRQAVITLQMEGLLDTRQGARRTVLRAAPAPGPGQPGPGQGPEQHGAGRQSFGRLQSFAQWAVREGRVPGGLILRTRRVPATEDQAAQLGVASGDAVLRVLRLRTLDGEPVLVERIVYATWVADAVAALPRDTPSLTEALEKTADIAYGQGKHTIDAVGAGTAEATLLGIRRRSPMLRHRYVVATGDGRPFVASDDRYKPGAMAITLDNDVAGAISREAVT
jgi:GntR family transcriptional regulator